MQIEAALVAVGVLSGLSSLRVRQVDVDALMLWRDSAPKLEEIREYVRSGSGAPIDGSSLAVDDRLWPHHPTSQVAWLAMVSACDHLEVVSHVAASAEARTFITAPFSVARGALVAASQALWILGADDPTARQQRALSIAIEGLVQRIGYQTEQLKVCSADQKVASEAQIENILKPMLNDALARTRKGFRYTDTEVIRQATLYRFAGAENLDAAVVTADLHWRRLGGDAHALGWQLSLGEVSWTRGRDPEVLEPASVSGDLKALLQASLWAETLLRVARDRHLALAG